MKYVQTLTLLVFTFISLTLQASETLPFSKSDVPDPLKSWIPWALHGQEARTCPHIFNQNNKTVCAWATKLNVKLRKKGGKFSQRWQVFAPSWLRLPGDQKHWPQNVKLNGKTISVTQDASGNPAVFVKKGRLTIEGDFVWSELPETLSLPPNTGLVSLTLNGKSNSFPVIDDQHRLWLSKSSSGDSETKSDTIDIQVFRKITDNIPMNVQTHLILKVTGKQREITLGPMPVNFFIPQSLNSQLPAQLESDGLLRIQVRPGVWRVNIVTRSVAQMERLTFRGIAEPWPSQELWVFEAKNNYRLVDIQKPSIESRQTNIPDNWKKFPAYLMNRGDEFKMTTIRRGNSEPEPDQLRLQRNLWLDFDGAGYTFQDNINGKITSGWRLETEPLLNLGRVSINGEPQFITRLNKSSKRSGVEVRRGQLQLSADGRIMSDQRRLPVTGWDKEFTRIDTKLHLPPGWSALYAMGTDNQPNTFVQRWTLLDLFMVLVISVIIGRMWSWPWGVLALLTMSLIWHEANAPHYTWLNLLIAIALVKVFPVNRFAVWVRAYRHVSLILLILFLLPFVIQQARIGLHPQLAAHYGLGDSYENYSLVVAGSQPPEEEAGIYGLFNNFSDGETDQSREAPQSSSVPRKKLKPGLSRSLAGDSLGSLKQAQNYQLIDPSATIQTGYGLPSWSWRVLKLSWNGPVVKEQEFRLLLVSPALNRILSFLRIALIASLLMLLIGYSFSKLKGLLRVNKSTVSSLIAVTVLFVASSGFSPAVYAESSIPDKNVLKTLRDRLLSPPNCLPQCAQASRMHMNANSKSLQIRLQIHAAEDVAVPLPGSIKSWNPSKVLVDGKEATALQRDNSGMLWIRLTKGVHKLNLHGPIPKLAHFTVELPLIPKQVTHKISGWRLDGIHKSGRVDSQIQFSRKITVGNKADIKFEQSSLPAFVYVERTLSFGIDWTIETKVIRATPVGAAIVLNVPLIKGETVTSDINVQENQVVVNMSPQQKVFVWRSSLTKGEKLTLRTSENPDWFEVWRADISPIWHAELKGIAPVSHYDASRQWLPEWHPWPSESVHFTLTRPTGIAGNTLTIDSSRLDIETSKRASAYKLWVTIRSSQGGKHQFVMPEGTELQSVKINNRAMPIRLEDQILTLPITPGKQQVEIIWRLRAEFSNFFKTPKVKLGIESTNNRTYIQMNRDRWVLFVGGPQLGPAVLFWGVLIVLALISIGLGRIKTVPLKSWHWFLLAVGLMQVSIWTALIFLGSFFALAYRQQSAGELKPWLFNIMQIGIAILTVVAGIILIVSIHQGLLGYPDMQIAGNGSSSYNLIWYDDRVSNALSQPWVLSVSIIWYRALMLLWALWLALAVIRWSKWAWTCYVTDGLWKASPLPLNPDRPAPPTLPGNKD
ncbi:hypothetical protein MNBD_GAMMA21-2837 [hydrothermal vent metagenome]|uniref:Uncharacterized protein n=1 Tax=hydrothermal vent metagenome TaxID=652676 RepID=A0A3B0ZRT7_9ZZZZ